MMMSTGATVPRSTRSPNAPTASSRDWLETISTKAKPRPSTVVLYGVPGVGKTSVAAAIPNVVFLTDPQEDGIGQLKDAGLVRADIPVFDPPTKWPDVFGILESLATNDHGYKCLAIDALGGFERLCHAEVCRREFNGEWGERGFASFQKGFEVSLAEWILLIHAIDRLRDERKMAIMLLGHARVAPFQNPEGPDYDRYSVDIHRKTWSLTHKWADMVLFANYDVAFGKGDDTKKKAKAKGGKSRTLYTEYTAAFDAKNRHNLPEEIDMGSSGQEA